MAVSYKKLWKMLIDKDMKKKEPTVIAIAIKSINNLAIPPLSIIPVL